MDIHFDTIIRLTAVGAGMLLLLLSLTGQVRRPLKIPLAGMIIGGAAYLINSATYIEVPRIPLRFIDLFSILTPFWTWLFAKRLFELDPPKSFWLGILVVLLFSWILSHFAPGAQLTGFYLNHGISLFLIADLIYAALSGLRDDLVRKRRLIRIYLPILVGLQASGILIFELFFGTTDAHPAVQTGNALLIFALVLFGGLALLRTEPELLAVIDDEPDRKAAGRNLTASEKVLHDRLAAAMADHHYRETGLTIQKLAEHLQTPEHRLRALINQKLGHRNFSSFLNGYRIGEAKQKLADRALVDLPILTIAMDLGYNSLAPFNRAFRAETGVTPSDFRRSAIDRN